MLHKRCCQRWYRVRRLERLPARGWVVLPDKFRKVGAGLVLAPDFAAIRLSFGLRIDSGLAGKILDNLSIGKKNFSLAAGGNVLVVGD